jgi:hypothetical protein
VFECGNLADKGKEKKSTESAPKEPKPAKKSAPNKTGDEAMSNKALSERIAQLEETPFRQRTIAEAQELNDLLILRKQRARGKKK